MTRVRKILWWSAGLVVGGALAFAAAVGWLSEEFRKAGPSERDTVLIFPKGSRLPDIAERLAGAGVVSSARVFMAGTWWLGADRQLKAGEYRFPAGSSAYQAMMQMKEGRLVARRLTVPEGLTVAEVQRLLAGVDGLTADEAMESVPEGSLLPETYFFAWGDTQASVQGRMKRAMEDALAELWEKRKPGLAIRTPAEALVLASLIEKETGRADERARVSAVFHNRLRRGMKLQSDPTVIYGITLGKVSLGRDLTRADLEQANPFNTYRIDGLPPQPIANPGRAAIQAALQPLDTREIYFVADGDGGHHFAETLEQHNRNVQRWRRVREAQRQGQGQTCGTC